MKNFQSNKSQKTQSSKSCIVCPPKRPLEGVLYVPGDKSAGHRALILASIADGSSVISGLSKGKDILSTINALKTLGIKFHKLHDSTLIVRGKGLKGFIAPKKPVYCGNSGTTARLLAGLLSGAGISCIISGDKSLSERPMKRIIEPLRMMNANISGRKDKSSEEYYLPLKIECSPGLKGMKHIIPVASAQVKSSLLLAGLHARGITEVTEPAPSRDHTEIMLQSMGCKLSIDGLTVSLSGLHEKNLIPIELEIPGDPSTAAFFAVAAILVPGSRIEIRKICLSPSRRVFVDLLKRMGADIEVIDEQDGTESYDSLFPTGTIIAKGGRSLRGLIVEKEEIPGLVDEIPVLSVAAGFAAGKTVFRGAKELRNKETDRIEAIKKMLAAFGIKASEQGDDLVIKGNQNASVCEKHPDGMVSGLNLTKNPSETGPDLCLDSFGDHRMAMSAAVLALRADSLVRINDFEAVSMSCPDFLKLLNSLCSDSEPLIRADES